MSERIYIQTGEDFEEDVKELNDEMTWCAERVYASDIEYVRADIHAAALARVARLEEVLREFADESNWDGDIDDFPRWDAPRFAGMHNPARFARAALEAQP